VAAGVDPYAPNSQCSGLDAPSCSSWRRLAVVAALGCAGGASGVAASDPLSVAFAGARRPACSPQRALSTRFKPRQSGGRHTTLPQNTPAEGRASAAHAPALLPAASATDRRCGLLLWRDRSCIRRDPEDPLGDAASESPAPSREQRSGDCGLPATHRCWDAVVAPRIMRWGRAVGARARWAGTRPAGCGRRRCGCRSSRGRRPGSRRRCVPRPWRR
jgi:hypothetical protein